MRMDGETPLAAGVRIMPLIAAGVLPIQGPPWTLHQAWPQRRAAIHALRPKTCRSRMSNEADMKTGTNAGIGCLKAGDGISPLSVEAITASGNKLPTHPSAFAFSQEGSRADMRLRSYP